MSGHSKWSTIKRKKGAADAKRGQVFTTMGRAIAIAAREGGADLETNFTLRLAVEKARKANMPMDNVDRAIKRGTGEIEDEAIYEKCVYGGYGSGGVALAVDVVTDNKNRTVSVLRSIFENHGGNLADASSVLWQFHEKGSVVVKCAKLKKSSTFGKEDTEDAVDSETVMMELIDIAGVEDVKAAEGEDAGRHYCEAITLAKELAHVRDDIAKLGYIIDSSGIVKVPERPQTVSPEVLEKIQRLVEALEESDDVESVWVAAE